MNKGGTAEIGETLEVWFLGRTAISKPNNRMSTLARRTGYWHHQIRLGGRSAEFARSKPHGPEDEDWSVHAVIESNLPAKIDAAIELIDADATFESSLSRLLIVPAYLTTAIWVLMDDGNDQIVVVDSPKKFGQLRSGAIYTGVEFASALGVEKYCQGLPRRPSHILP